MFYKISIEIKNDDFIEQFILVLYSSQVYQFHFNYYKCNRNFEFFNVKTQGTTSVYEFIQNDSKHQIKKVFHN